MFTYSLILAVVVLAAACIHFCKKIVAIKQVCKDQKKIIKGFEDARSTNNKKTPSQSHASGNKGIAKVV